MPIKDVALPEDDVVAEPEAAPELELPPAVTADDDDLELLDELSDL